MREAGEDRERGVAVEAVGLVHLRHIVAGSAERRHLQIAVDSEGLPHRHFDVGSVSRHVAAVQDRKSVVSGKSVSVLVVLGGRRIIQKKIKEKQISRILQNNTS